MALLEDEFQYRIHNILNKIDTDGMTITSYLDTRDGMIEFAKLVLDDIDVYCGLQEAINNKF